MIVALYAALAMFVQDILGVLLVQAEARNHDHLAGFLDSAGYLCLAATSTIAITALQGHNLGLKVGVLSAVTVANYLGTVTGVRIGRRFIGIRK